MFLRINSILPVGRDYKVVSLFGYRSNGVPGIEIKGLPCSQNIVREKLVYLSKLYGVKVPIRKFHLCLDLPKEVTKLKKELVNDRCFDLPLLLLYWSLAEIVNIQNIEYCFALGTIQPDGRILIPKVSSTYLYHLNNVVKEKTANPITFIADQVETSIEIQQIPIAGIFQGVVGTKSKVI